MTPPAAHHTQSYLGLTLLAILGLLTYDLLSGPVKFLLLSAGLNQAWQAFNLGAMAMVGLYTLGRAKHGQLTPTEGLAILVFGFLLLYTYLIGAPLPRLGLGLIIGFLFLTGFLSPLQLLLTLQKLAPWFWAIATLGVLINTSYTYPWEEQTYQVLGLDRELSKQWWAFEQDRLAGFAQNNFAASFQICIYGLLFIWSARSALTKLVVYGATLTALYYTTAKMPLAAFGLLGAYAMVAPWLPSVIAKRTHAAALIVAGAMLVLLPLLALSLEFNLDTMYGAYLFFTLQTIGERLVFTWPTAIQLLELDQTFVTYLFGRGFGGIGTPQQFVALEIANPGDNLFIVLYVTAGLMGLAAILLLLRGIWRAYAHAPYQVWSFVGILVLLLGVTNGLMEAITAGVMVGALAGLTFKLPAKPAESDRSV